MSKRVRDVNLFVRVICLCATTFTNGIILGIFRFAQLGRKLFVSAVQADAKGVCWVGGSGIILGSMLTPLPGLAILNNAGHSVWEFALS